MEAGTEGNAFDLNVIYCILYSDELTTDASSGFRTLKQRVDSNG